MHHNPEHHETDLEQAILTLKREYWENETFFVDTALYPYKLSDLDKRLRDAETEMQRQNDLSDAVSKKLLNKINALRKKIADITRHLKRAETEIESPQEYSDAVSKNIGSKITTLQKKLSDIDKRIRDVETEVQRQNDLSQEISKKLLNEIDYLRTLRQMMETQYQQHNLQKSEFKSRRKNAYQNIQVLNFVWTVLNKAIENLEEEKNVPISLKDIRHAAFTYMRTRESKIEVELQIDYMKGHLSPPNKKDEEDKELVVQPKDILRKSKQWMNKKLTPSTDIDEA